MNNLWICFILDCIFELILDHGPFNWLKTDFEHPHADTGMYNGYLTLQKRDVLRDQNLGENDTLTVRLTFTKVNVDILEIPNEKLLHDQVAKVENGALSLDMEKLLVDP